MSNTKVQQQVYILSDGSGVTAQTICQSLFTQFSSIQFDIEEIPFLDTQEKVSNAATRINERIVTNSQRPMIFTTFAQLELSASLQELNANIIDLFDPIIGRMENILGVNASHEIGRSHGIADNQSYHRRIDALNYTLRCDDGLNPQDYDKATMILIGVSRSGKTPTSLYLSLQFSYYTANYPLVEDDFETGQLPKSLLSHKQKLFGLIIDPNRLHQIRQERRPNSQYSSFAQCRRDVQLATDLYRRYAIPYCDSTNLSVEELGSKIKQHFGLSS